MTKTLQKKFEKDFGETIRGCYVLGNYIYVMADGLYRCPLDGDEIGEIETTIPDVYQPNTITSDGSYLYIGSSWAGDGRNYLSVFEINTLEYKTKLQLNISSHHTRKIQCDSLGSIHAIIVYGGYEIYKYDSSNNNIQNVYVYDSDLYGDIEDLTVIGDHVYLCTEDNQTIVMKWNGDEIESTYEGTDSYNLQACCEYNGKFAAIKKSFTLIYGLYDFDGENLLKIDNGVDIGGSSGLTLSKYGMISDSTCIYHYYGGSSSNRIEVIGLNENDVFYRLSYIDFESDFNPVSSGYNRQLIGVGNNGRVYVGNDNKIHVLRFSVESRFNIDIRNGRVPLTVNFQVVE